jgi:hypothetical protein
MISIVDSPSLSAADSRRAATSLSSTASARGAAR